MLIFVVINGGASNGAPYLLWTSIFTNRGIRKLDDRGILLDEAYTSDSSSHLTELNTEPITVTNEIRFCRKCGEKLIDNSRFCRKCGTQIVKEQQNDL